MKEYCTAFYQVKLSKDENQQQKPTHVCKLVLADCILQIKHMLVFTMAIISHWIHWPNTAENYLNQEFVNQE